MEDRDVPADTSKHVKKQVSASVNASQEMVGTLENVKSTTSVAKLEPGKNVKSTTSVAKLEPGKNVKSTTIEAKLEPGKILSAPSPSVSPVPTPSPAPSLSLSASRSQIASSTMSQVTVISEAETEAESKTTPGAQSMSSQQTGKSEVEPESTSELNRHHEGVMRTALDYPENAGDEIIWPDEKTYSEELLPEYFYEALDEDAVMSLQTREDLVIAYKAMIQDRNRLLIINQKLQSKAMDFLQKKKVATIKTSSKEPSARMQIDYEEKFSRYLYVWESLMATYTKDEEQLSNRFKVLSTAYESKLQENEKENETFIQFKRTHIKGAVNSQTGEKLTENEGLAGGHHMYDFEQLKIENQAYNEKIEERNEELSKLRRKIMNTLQVMGHIKEKIYFMANENETTKRILAELDADANKKREHLSKMKQVKDSLREDRGKLQQKSGLLGKSLMLRDMRLKQENVIQLKNELNNLKINHHGYTTGIERLNAQFKLANLTNY
uniref:CCDC113/CCDC96 coiled-coil domain-containing protein n=1 Tax=Strigamia maritima TaxID=126957 RepID=T1IHW2_STRMM